MRRETQNVLLVLLGGALLKISLNGSFSRYVKPGQLPWLIAAGVVMVVVAFVSIVRDIITAKRPATELDDAHDHPHKSHSTWLLLLPVFAIFLIAPPALGADSVNRAGNRTPPVLDSQDYGFGPLPAGEVIDQRLKDFFERAAWDKSGSLNERKVRLTGFVVHKDNVTYIARMTIGCCAADAYPVRVEMQGEGLGKIPNDSWVQATVRYQVGTATKERAYIPKVNVHDITSTTEPAEPYEY
ncbi:MAG: TIGR03943 family protein [Kibdelosporangium sp.]